MLNHDIVIMGRSRRAVPRAFSARREPATESGHSTAQVAQDLGLTSLCCGAGNRGHQRSGCQPFRLKRDLAHEARAGFFDSYGGVLCQSRRHAVQAMRNHEERFSVRVMDRALTVFFRATYACWAARPESRRTAANRRLLTMIRVIHAESQSANPCDTPGTEHADRRESDGRGSCARKRFARRPSRCGGPSLDPFSTRRLQRRVGRRHHGDLDRGDWLYLAVVHA